MNILIAGASGFIGQKLVAALQAHHGVTVLGRDMATLQRHFSKTSAVSRITWEMLPELEAKSTDVVINLCGHNIAASRWSEQVKKQLIYSRIKTSTKLIDWAIKQAAKPHFISANAVGIYGMQSKLDSNALDENSFINMDTPCDFISEIGIRWQQALQPAIDFGMPVTSTRFGVVLERGEGMLKKLSPSFQLGLGSTIGDGKQMISWVHINDLINAMSFLIQHRELTGAFNICSPFPVTQAEFARTFATTLHRPLLFKMPAFIIRLLFGEMGECLLLNGQRVLPKRLLDLGFQFSYPQLNEALAHEYV